ncbi:putative methylenetetrahydrofolate reductase 2 [Mollisia scopiformis]|uniref:Putative methylenetetrahydrofolate reductase 2 n=1 Tax=Mollisia scopiformis TaxID=149040 RepID=A0A194XAZ9_MOLSC|nr:putative methylenetetrahydrofolate reductase 2 [Mollisia scopiformis]KUJ17348.1 putative methylenetetrahydrofolate reductase 2 [Mollisia scopiformis]
MQYPLFTMEKITDKIAALPPGSNYFSLEFFPPKTSMGSANLRARLDRMSRALRPLFVTVTWGAGGSTAEKSLELAELCQRELGLTTCLHLTCTNMSKKLVDKALQDAKALGVRNILALRGDPPRSEEYKERINVNGNGIEGMEEEDEFEWAIDLVKYIRKMYGDYFCIGVAAYPEGHADEGHPEGQSLEHDLPYLVGKTQAGADFIMTQLFFDVEAYDKFEKRLREHESGAFKTIPIIPGMMPIQSYQMIKRTTKLSHARLPPNIISRLDEVKGDDEMVKKVGVDIVSEIVTHIQQEAAPGPRGFHFYTLNLEKAVSFILERTNLIPTEDLEDESAVLEISVPLQSLSVNGAHSNHASRRQSSIGSDPHNRVIVTGPTSNSDWEATALDAAMPADPINTRANTLAISEGEGALGREATWDDFPNGRWGDARSPAYGEIDGYGVSLHMSVNQAIKLWGFPKSVGDITELFIKHIEGSLSAIPWSEEGLNEETNTIKSQLLQLNQKGWWSVASQPAVNGVRSTDPVFGWGPRNGFVFQKAFIELFLPSKDWTPLKEKLMSEEIKENVSWYAANASSQFFSSDSLMVNGVGTRGDEGGSTNAVTWGAFPGKEIITPTIIEEVSFRAWAEEAFGIWEEWGRVYERESESKKLIEGVREDYWLVNVIHHGYVEGEGLWDLLLK